MKLNNVFPLINYRSFKSSNNETPRLLGTLERRTFVVVVAAAVVVVAVVVVVVVVVVVAVCLFVCLFVCYCLLVGWM